MSEEGLQLPSTSSVAGAPKAISKVAPGRCTLLVAVLLSVLGLVNLVFGIHDIALASTLAGRIVGGLVVVVGGLTLAPVVLLAIGPNRGLDPVAGYVAAALLLTQAIGVLIAEGSSGALSTPRTIAPVVMCTVSVLVFATLRRERDEQLQPPLKFAIRASFAVAVLSALQIAAGLANSPQPTPGRILLTSSATLHAGTVAVTMSAANHGSGDIPVIADLFDVVALKCPPARMGDITAQISLKQREIVSFGVGGWLTSLEVAGCSKPELMDTGVLTGEGNFAPPTWSIRETRRYPIPPGRNTICVYAAMSTIEQSLQRLGFAGPTQKDEALVYRYPLEASGWIDGFVHPSQEVVTRWRKNAEGGLAGTASYPVPEESTEYLVNGITQYSPEFLSRASASVTSNSVACS